MRRLFFLKCQIIIPNAHLILELLELVLSGAKMKLKKKFFKQILGIVMGTNLEHSLAYIFVCIYIHIYIYIYVYVKNNRAGVVCYGYPN